jgi:hypothetical protein
VKEQLKRSAQALEADAAVAAEPSSADADGAAAQQAAAGGAKANKAQQRAKKADDYHARHQNWVAQFNELTGGECAGGDAGVKFAAVRAWQQKHWQLNNLLADGLIGPKTLEAAKLLQKKNAPKKESADDKNAAGDKEHAAPEAGQAEGAEAAADKPKLDEESPETGDDQKVVEDGKPKSKTHAKATPQAFRDVLKRIDDALDRFKMIPQAAAAPPAAKGEKDATPGKAAPLDLAMPAPAALEKYDSVAQAMIDNWSTMLPHARFDRLLAAVNQALDTEQVPHISGWNETASKTIAGQFHPASWTIDLSSIAFGKHVDNARKIDAVKTVFHEGRHAHQRFTMARLLATQGQSEGDIASLLQMDAKKVALAVKSAAQQPMDTNSAEARAAGAMVNDAGVHGPEHRATERSANELTQLGNEAFDIYSALPDKAPFATQWAEYARRMHEAIDAYHNLPTEHDAEAAERAVQVQPSKK